MPTTCVRDNLVKPSRVPIVKYNRDHDTATYTDFTGNKL